MFGLIGALLSPRVLAGLGLAIAVAAGVWYIDHHAARRQAAIDSAQLERERTGYANERARASEIAAAWERQARDADDEQRAKERMWTDVARSIDRDANKTIQRTRAVAVRADAAASGLSVQLAAVVADAASAAQASAGSADARERAAAAEAVRVLALMHGECVRADRARSLYADSVTAAAERCERWADTLERAASAPGL